ncbi:serine hydrolase [Variovorax sp. J31P179]|uniref:serine hydrolase n=1 Tax=Variovorax sp. J31P179 TaxID=3053508 RepID=UPI002577D1E0|nr:serine hydrolase [Variovorax sp. J31P179]MDM0085071.1 serine hydrolase [Variovorax sp. J31P179]
MQPLSEPPTSLSPSRRLTLKLAASAFAAQVMSGCGGSDAVAGPVAPTTPIAVTEAVNGFGALAPDATHCLVQVEGPAGMWSASWQPDRQLFVGSAVKTFMLAQTVLDMADLRNGLNGATQQPVSDKVRSPGSPVLQYLDGTLSMRSVLEAMIAHSDNTATDIALAAATPARVRQLIARAGLANTQIPDSTRQLFSYLAGAPAGVDLGWAGLMATPDPNPNARPAVNDVQSMRSTATELVNWYRLTLAEGFFPNAAALTEYKRILAMADAIAVIVPPDIAAFGKGGSIDWEGFHALCFAGRMVVDRTPVTFCFTYNWSGAEMSTGAPFERFAQRSSAVLKSVVQALRN